MPLRLEPLARPTGWRDSVALGSAPSVLEPQNRKQRQEDVERGACGWIGLDATAATAPPTAGRGAHVLGAHLALLAVVCVFAEAYRRGRESGAAFADTRLVVSALFVAGAEALGSRRRGGAALANAALVAATIFVAPAKPLRCCRRCWCDASVADTHLVFRAFTAVVAKTCGRRCRALVADAHGLSGAVSVAVAKSFLCRGRSRNGCCRCRWRRRIDDFDLTRDGVGRQLIPGNVAADGVDEVDRRRASRCVFRDAKRAAEKRTGRDRFEIVLRCYGAADGGRIVDEALDDALIGIGTRADRRVDDAPGIVAAGFDGVEERCIVLDIDLCSADLLPFFNTKANRDFYFATDWSSVGNALDNDAQADRCVDYEER